MTAASDAALETQAEISAEMATIARDHSPGEPGAPGSVGDLGPRLDFAPYRSSRLRHPKRALRLVDPERTELAGPAFGERDVDLLDADLTVGHAGDPVGERMVVTGRVLDGEGRPVRGQLVEVWQANAAGRYVHERDQHPAPLDPNFVGTGRCLTDDDGRYRFTTIKPGPYPWRNHRNAWRPAHIHFSVFGTSFTQRLVTQMYFAGDPLFDLDPIFSSVLDPSGRSLMVAAYDHDVTQHEWCTGYTWDIVLSGTRRTPTEADVPDVDAPDDGDAQDGVR